MLIIKVSTVDEGMVYDLHLNLPIYGEGNRYKSSAYKELKEAVKNITGVLGVKIINRYCLRIEIGELFLWNQLHELAIDNSKLPIDVTEDQVFVLRENIEYMKNYYVEDEMVKMLMFRLNSPSVVCMDDETLGKHSIDFYSTNIIDKNVYM